MQTATVTDPARQRFDLDQALTVTERTLGGRTEAEYRTRAERLRVYAAWVGTPAAADLYRTQASMIEHALSPDCSATATFGLCLSDPGANAELCYGCLLVKREREHAEALARKELRRLSRL